MLIMAIDMIDIKAKQQKVWSSGEYGRIANQLNSMADLLCEAAHVLPHHRVLDIATGTGNTAIAAANRNNTTVTGNTITAVLFGVPGSPTGLAT
jgi:cyclopropane fatty-acyl-phospholipid synthase-like methyltransferase